MDLAQASCAPNKLAKSKAATVLKVRPPTLSSPSPGTARSRPASTLTPITLPRACCRKINGPAFRRMNTLSVTLCFVPSVVWCTSCVLYVRSTENVTNQAVGLSLDIHAHSTRRVCTRKAQHPCVERTRVRLPSAGSSQTTETAINREPTNQSHSVICYILVSYYEVPV